jgi:hypothetical protein
MTLRAAIGVFCVLSNAFAAPKTKNVILITADGLRWQELFTGIDPALMNQRSAGMRAENGTKESFWRETAEERRKVLLPFFWNELAPNGIVLGNVGKDSSVRVANSFRVSYPGYSEILTGRAQDGAIQGNDPIQNPSRTVLEFVRSKLGLSSAEVALFASWNVFEVIGESRKGTVHINAGYAAAANTSPRMKELSELQFQVLTPWSSVRHDHITLEMAMEHLKTAQPRFLHIALGETDDWAHDRRYDRVLDAIQFFDSALRRVWTYVQSSPQYRDSTSLVVTVDHGRGSTLTDWHSHGKDVPGAEQIWVAVIGPDTPAKGEITGSEPALQRDVAPTILAMLGIDYREYQGVEGKPISIAIR